MIFKEHKKKFNKSEENTMNRKREKSSTGKMKKFYKEYEIKWWETHFKYQQKKRLIILSLFNFLSILNLIFFGNKNEGKFEKKNKISYCGVHFLSVVRLNAFDDLAFLNNLAVWLIGIVCWPKLSALIKDIFGLED
mgnify:CR=1 FL=1